MEIAAQQGDERGFAKTEEPHRPLVQVGQHGVVEQIDHIFEDPVGLAAEENQAAPFIGQADRLDGQYDESDGKGD